LTRAICCFFIHIFGVPSSWELVLRSSHPW
jgi:hypothetical protein